MNEPKNCPFCGEMPETDGRLVQCYLMPCDARHMKLPIKSWNTRPIEDALNARIAKLVNLVEVQHDDNCHLADMCRERDARIAELEALVGELIEAGDAIINAYPTWAKENAWNALVEEWKAREK